MFGSKPPAPPRRTLCARHRPSRHHLSRPRPRCISASARRQHLAAQARTVGGAERGLVLDAGGGLQKTRHLLANSARRGIFRSSPRQTYRCLMATARSSVTVKKKRSAVTVKLMLGGRTRFRVRCNWKSRKSSAVAVFAGDRPRKIVRFLTARLSVLLRLLHRSDATTCLRSCAAAAG